MAEPPIRGLRVRPTVTPHLGSRQASAVVLTPVAAGGVNPAALLTNLVAYWPLDEASGTRVDAHAALDLSPQNTPGQAEGIVGQAVACNGAANRFLSRASHADLVLGSTDLTLAFWVYSTDWTNTPVLVSKWNFGGDDREYLVQVDNAGLLTWLVRHADNAGQAAVDAGFFMSTAIWYFVVVWADFGQDVVGMQVEDDAPRTAALTQAGRSGASNLDLGGHSYASLALNGRVDEAGVWRRVLTHEERLYLYNGGAGRTYPFA